MKGHPVCVSGILALILVPASVASAQQVVRRTPPPPSLIELRVLKTVVRMELFGVVLIAFFAMQVGVHPRTLGAFVLLSGFVGPSPITLGIPP
jgi:hypothetical protein